MKPKTKKRVEGVISLMLTIVLLPVLSVTGVVVEANRYQSAQALLSETMGSAAYSTLAKYDPYLLDRFGMLATNQEIDISKTYASYLNSNLPLVNDNGLSEVQYTAEGIYPLTDPDMLYYQIMEMGKLLGPTTFAEDVVELDELISQIEKNLHVMNAFNGIGKLADCVDDMAGMATDVEKLKDACDTLHTIINTTYQEKYNAFSTAVSTYDTDAAAYIEAKKAAEQAAKPESSAVGSANSETTLSSATDAALLDAQTKFDTSKTAADTARTDYKTLLDSYVAALQTYKEKLQSYQQNKNELVKNLVELGTTGGQLLWEDQNIRKDKDKNQTEQQTQQQKEEKEQIEALNQATHKTMVDVANNGVNGMIGVMDEALEGYLDTNLDPYIQKVNEVVASLDKVSFELKTDGTAPTVKIVDYQITEFPPVPPSDKLQSVLDQMQSEMNDPGVITMTKKLVEVVNAFVDFDGVVDTALNAGIDTKYYQDNCGGLPSNRMQKAAVNQSDFAEAQSNIAEINQSLNGIQDWLSQTGVPDSTASKIIENIRDFNQAVVKLTSPFSLISTRVKAAATVCRCIAVLCENMQDTVTVLFNNVHAVVGEKIILSQYLTGMLPNRLNYNSGSAINGYSFNGIALKPAASISNVVPTLGTMLEKVGQSEQELNGKDIMFCGAELEYVLSGSPSEYRNQTNVFIILYMLRLLVDSISVLSSEFVLNLAGTSIIGFIAAFCILLAEPLLSTLLLVNDGEVPMYKNNIYLSPSGFFGYMESLSHLPKLEKVFKGSKLETKLNEFKRLERPQSSGGASGSTTEDKPLISWKDYGKSLISLDYEQHLLGYMCLFMKRERLLAHLANLIQMEAESDFREKNKVAHFDLGKSFTFVRSEVSGSVNQVMPIPTLSSRSLLKTRILQYRGY